MTRTLPCLALAAGLLAGCASLPGLSGATPQQSVFAARSTYAVALTEAVKYRELPPCPANAPPCSDPAIVAQLQKADTVASAALAAAEAAVRTPAVGASAIDRAVQAAVSALGALTAIVSALKGAQ